MKISKADLAEHARTYIAVLTTMADAGHDEPGRDLVHQASIMLREMDYERLMVHVMFLYRCQFADISTLIDDYKDTWPAYLEGAAATFRAKYEGEGG